MKDILKIRLSQKQINIIRRNPKKQNWNVIFSDMFILSEEFLREFINIIDDKNGNYWSEVCCNQTLSEGFIKEFSDKVNWDNISIFQKLSENFIREFQDKVNWNCISYSQELSEDFIIEFQDKVNWYNISYYQELSKNLL